MDVEGIPVPDIEAHQDHVEKYRKLSGHGIQQ
jgi:hypothetical protein